MNNPSDDMNAKEIKFDTKDAESDASTGIELGTKRLSSKPDSFFLVTDIPMITNTYAYAKNLVPLL